MLTDYERQMRKNEGKRGNAVERKYSSQFAKRPAPKRSKPSTQKNGAGTGRTRNRYADETQYKNIKIDILLPRTKILYFVVAPLPLIILISPPCSVLCPPSSVQFFPSRSVRRASKRNRFLPKFRGLGVLRHFRLTTPV